MLSFAAGGDGTVTGVATALLGTDKCLGINPSGTAQWLLLPTLASLEIFSGACKVIKAGHRKKE